MRNLLLFAAIPSLLLLLGCGSPFYSAPVQPPPGLLLTTYDHPLTTDFTGFSKDRLDRVVVSKSSMYVWDILITGLSVSWDEQSFHQEARRQGLESVEYLEHEYLSVFFFVFASSKVIAYGYTAPREPTEQ